MHATWTQRLADVAERLVKTFLQAFCASLIYTGFDDWQEALKLAAGAGLLSVATSVASWKLGNTGTASALPEDLDPATPPGTT